MPGHPQVNLKREMFHSCTACIIDSNRFSTNRCFSVISFTIYLIEKIHIISQKLQKQFLLSWIHIFYHTVYFIAKSRINNKQIITQ